MPMARIRRQGHPVPRHVASGPRNPFVVAGSSRSYPHRTTIGGIERRRRSRNKSWKCKREMEMDDRTVRAALQRHWDASDAGDFNVEHEIYREDAVLDYPQSGERIRGRRNIQESRFVQPNRKHFTVRRMIGSGDLW